uniref:NAD(+) diphosphatase n=1 Tax=Hirondellea gigas TaxID=1518452 RepID=A0A6A7GEV9_9CRUS
MQHTFAGSPLNSCQNERRDEVFVSTFLEDRRSRILPVLANGKILVDDQISSSSIRPPAQLRWLSLQEFDFQFMKESKSDVADSPSDGVVFLGVLNEIGHFAGLVQKDLSASDLLRFVSLRSLFYRLDSKELAIAGQASVLIKWREVTRFCSECGSALISKAGGFRLDCPNVRALESDPKQQNSSCSKVQVGCGAQNFPRVDPAVIMLITDGSRCVLASRPRRVGSMYSVLAGFVSPGESIEEAVRRETFEEIGLRVGEVRYHSSQPWMVGPHFAQLMVGCICWVLSGEENRELLVDAKELKDARWFSPEEAVIGLDNAKHVPAASDETFRVPPDTAIAHHLIRYFVESISKPQLPLRKSC